MFRFALGSCNHVTEQSSELKLNLHLDKMSESWVCNSRIAVEEEPNW